MPDFKCKPEPARAVYHGEKQIRIFGPGAPADAALYFQAGYSTALPGEESVRVFTRDLAEVLIRCSDSGDPSLDDSFYTWVPTAMLGAAQVLVASNARGTAFDLLWDYFANEPRVSSSEVYRLLADYCDPLPEPQPEPEPAPQPKPAFVPHPARKLCLDLTGVSDYASVAVSVASSSDTRRMAYVSAGLLRKADALVQAGHVIEAIKLIRKECNYSLYEAKSLVDWAWPHAA